MCVRDYASVCEWERSFVAEPTMMIFYNQKEVYSYHRKGEKVCDWVWLDVFVWSFFKGIRRKEKMCSLSKTKPSFNRLIENKNIPIENDNFITPSFIVNKKTYQFLWKPYLILANWMWWYRKQKQKMQAPRKSKTFHGCAIGKSFLFRKVGAKLKRIPINIRKL